MNDFVELVNAHYGDLMPNLNNYLESNIEGTDSELGSEEGQQPPSQEEGSQATDTALKIENRQIQINFAR